jgi:hypothetical protein
MESTGVYWKPVFYDRQHTHRVTRRAIHLLERQGYRVTLQPVA